jgi:hypothetical protein
MSGATPSILDDACLLAEQGVAVLWLRPRSKAPLADQWASAPIATLADLRLSWRAGLSLGIRPGEFSNAGALFLYAIDLDIRDADGRKSSVLPRRIVPDLNTLPFVKSALVASQTHNPARRALWEQRDPINGDLWVSSITIGRNQ